MCSSPRHHYVSSNELLSLLTSLNPCCCKLNTQSSGAAQSAAITNQNLFSHDHRFHDRSSLSRVLDHCCTSLLSTTMCLRQLKFSLCGILHARFLWLHLKWAFFRANAQVLFLLPRVKCPCWPVVLTSPSPRDRRRTEAAAAPGVSTGLAVFVLLHYTGWWSKCFSKRCRSGH